MSDSQALDSRATAAVVWRDGQPLFELAAQEIVYPIRSRDGRFKLLFHLRPYDPYPAKRIYDSIFPRRRALSPSEVQVQAPDLSDARQFVLDHFLRISGVRLEDGSEPTVEQQREWLAANPEWLDRVMRDGLDNWLPPESNEGDGQGPVLLFGPAARDIESRLRLYDPGRAGDVVATVTHTIGKILERDRHQYQKAVATIENVRQGEQRTECNWDVVEGLYNQRVQSLRGALLRDEACTEANREGKDGWKQIVPFLMKVYVVSTAIAETDLKNA